MAQFWNRKASMAGQFYGLLAAFALLVGVPSSAHAGEVEGAETELVVTLLGTGTPSLKPDRYGSAILVEAGETKLLFDAGRGASVRLAQAGTHPGEIDGIFITHFHSDHVNGLADVFLTGYITGGTLKAREAPMQLYGPAGTKELARGIQIAHRADAETRILDEGVARIATQIDVVEQSSGVIFEQDGVKVTIFSVNHGDLIDPAVGYKIEYDGKSVVISGDTTYDPIIAEMGTRVDVLIHEVGLAAEAIADRPVIQRIIAHHTSPEDVGRILDASQPKLAVITHMVLLGLPPVNRVVSGIRENYNGPLVIAEDLMQIRISRRGLTVMKAEARTDD